MKFIHIIWSAIFYLLSTSLAIVIAITVVTKLTNIFLK